MDLKGGRCMVLVVKSHGTQPFQVKKVHILRQVFSIKEFSPEELQEPDDTLYLNHTSTTESTEAIFHGVTVQSWSLPL